MEGARDGILTTAGPEWPTRLGHFELGESVGVGGGSRVFRARSDLGDGPVAVKVLHDLEPEGLVAFRREIELLRRLEHPGLVRILGHGFHEGAPWYAMDFLEGPTLADRMAESDAGAPDVLDALVRLCEVLAFLHCRGIVHRDLKPENVVLVPGRGPILIDFGFVTRFGSGVSRDLLAEQSTIAGTPHYVAPELLRGVQVDARADLYALGCMLYEALTGSPPFVGAPDAILAAHLRDDAPRLRDALPAVDGRLDTLVERLLRRDPAERLGYAAEVAAVLAEVLGRDPPQLEERHFVYRPRFVSTGGQLAELSAIVEEARAGRGGSALVLGPSGGGKTRLAMETAHEAARSGMLVAVAESSAREGARRGAPMSTLRPLVELMIDHCSARPEALERVFGASAPVLGRLDARLRARPDYEQAPDLPPIEARDRLVVAFVGTLARFTDMTPLCLLVDDLQWVDETSMACLAGVLRDRIRERSLVILGTCRSEDEASVPETFRRGVDRDVVVSPLDEVGVASIIADMLAVRSAPASLVRQIVRECEGNPFFVGEYVRAAIRSGVLEYDQRDGWRHASGASDAVELPSTIRTFVAQRLEDLDERSRHFVEVASVLGREFDPRLAADIASLDHEDLFHEIDALVRQHFVEPAGVDRLAFAHDKLREGAYAGMTDERRRSYHERYASWLSQHEADATADLAFHWSRAGRTDRSLEHLRRATEDAFEAGAVDDVQKFVDAIRAVPDWTRMLPSDECVRLMRMQVRSFEAVADWPRVIESAVALLAIAGIRVPNSSSGWWLAAARQIATQLWSTTRPARATGGDPVANEVVHALVHLADANYFAGRVEAGITCTVWSVNVAMAQGVPERSATAIGQFGYLMSAAGLKRIGARYQRRLLRLADAHDEVSVGSGLYWRSLYLYAFADWQGAVDAGLRSARMLEAVGAYQQAEIAHVCVAHALQARGDVRAAIAEMEPTLRAAGRRFDEQHLGWALMVTGRARLALGDAGAASDYLTESSEFLRRSHDRPTHIMSLGSLALAWFEQGEFGRAREIADRISDLSLGSAPLPLAQCLDGYRGAAMVYGSPVFESDAEAVRRADAFTDLLRRFAGSFPMARPAALAARAQRAVRRGRMAHAARGYDAALAEAERLEMPGEVLVIARRIMEQPHWEVTREAYRSLSESVADAQRRIGTESTHD